MKNKFRSECLRYSSFIVDLESAIERNGNIVSYKTYDTNTFRKCKELTNLMNEMVIENRQLKTQIQIFEMFLEENNLHIDWCNFCNVEKCLIDEDIEMDCKNCIYLIGDKND